MIAVDRNDPRFNEIGYETKLRCDLYPKIAEKLPRRQIIAAGRMIREWAIMEGFRVCKRRLRVGIGVVTVEYNAIRLKTRHQAWRDGMDALKSGVIPSPL